MPGENGARAERLSNYASTYYYSVKTMRVGLLLWRMKFFGRRKTLKESVSLEEWTPFGSFGSFVEAPQNVVLASGVITRVSNRRPQYDTSQAESVVMRTHALTRA